MSEEVAETAKTAIQELVDAKQKKAETTPPEAAPTEAKAKATTPPTPEELQKVFAEMLERPIPEGEAKQAEVELLICDIQLAQLNQAIANLEAQIAANKAEAAKVQLAQAIIRRRLHNK